MKVYICVTKRASIPLAPCTSRDRTFFGIGGWGTSPQIRFESATRINKELLRIIVQTWFTTILYASTVFWDTLQMKGHWESNINVWFWFMYFQKWNCGTSLFPKQNYKVQSPNFHIHVSVSDLYIPGIGLPILMQPNRQTDPGNL